MTAAKTRPIRGDVITNEMSKRDIAAALGVSTGQLCRWESLAQIPEEEFEHRINEHRRACRPMTTQSMIGGPVPARGRVQRAIALFNGMTLAERVEFKRALGQRVGTG